MQLLSGFHAISHGISSQLDAALAMPSSERAARLAKDYKFVCDNTTASWLRVAVQV